jgi:hypothetical protein
MKELVKFIYSQYLQSLWHDLQVFPHRNDPPKIDFLICGTQKGGTTSLYAYLKKHPEICMADYKEIHFFDTEKYFQYRYPDYRIYHECFHPSPRHLLLGEATPAYMYWYSAPRRIWEYNPNMKLILLLRNPIERAYSHWNMQRERGYDELSFLEAIKAEETRRRDALPYQNRRFSYLDRGFYSEQIKRLQTFFPEKQIKIFKSESLRQDPQRVLEEIYRYLGVSSIENAESLRQKAGVYRTSMDKETHSILKQIFTA